MLAYPIYKAIKEQLKNIAPCFYYRNQYKESPDNTSFKVPAIFIEMPKSTTLNFYGKKLLAAQKAQITIHYVSYAPFKAVDNSLQDTLLAAHNGILIDINKALCGWNAIDADSKILTQQFIPIASDELNFIPEKVFSTITYQTEIYTRHLQ